MIAAADFIITKAERSKLNEINLENIPFGKYFTDHMLEVDYEDGEWKLSNIDNIPQIMDKICLFTKDQIDFLRKKHINNKQLNDRLNVIEKYNNMIDEDYIQDLREDYNNNKALIKRVEDFQKMTYDTIKKTLYNEGKKLKKTIRQN